MLTPLLVWLAVTLIFIVAVLRWPFGSRMFAGFFFIGMAIIVNFSIALGSPDLFVGLGKDSFFPLYSWFFRDVVVKDPLLFVFPVILLEIAMGVMMLGRKPFARIGMIGAICFLVLISPLSIHTLPNLLFAAGLVVLYRTTPDRSFTDAAWGRVTPPRAH